MLLGLEKKLLERAKLSPFFKVGKWALALCMECYPEHTDLPLYPACQICDIRTDLPARFVDEASVKLMIRYYINPGWCLMLRYTSGRSCRSNILCRCWSLISTWTIKYCCKTIK